MRTEIIYEDSHVLVVYKPGGLATQTARAGEQDVVGELKNYLHRSNKGKTASARAGEEPYVGVVHRLDQPVEGLLVFAKNRKAAASLTAQLQKTGGSGMLHKCYYAAAWGTPPAPEGELVDYLLKSRDNRAVVAEQQSGAKKAVLRYRILGTRSLEEVFSRELPGGSAAAGLTASSLKSVSSEKAVILAEIYLLTGRFHQIRAQMAHAGLPLLGDRKYGSEESCALGARVGNVARCAHSLEFAHPVEGRQMDFHIEPRGGAFREFFGNIFS